MKNMKILEINKFNFPKGGADKHFLDVRKLLEENGHQVAVFAMQHEKNLPNAWSKYFVSKVGYTNEYTAWEKIKGTGRMFFSFETTKKINLLLDEFKPDLVHIHNIYHQLSPAILFAIKKRGIPIVMSVHDYKIISPNHALFLREEKYERCKNGKYYQCFFDRAIKNSYTKSFLAMFEMYWHERLGTYRKNIDLYLAPSEFVKKKLIEWGMDESKIAVFPHFISQNQNTTILQYPVGDEKDFSGQKYFLYAGRISKEKGIDKLLEIFAKNKEFKLLIAGACENEFEIPKMQNVEYVGFLNQAKLVKYVRSALAVVSPSHLPETFGLIALDAISNGVPFIGFNEGAYGEIVENGDHGFLVRDEEEMQTKMQALWDGKVIFNPQKLEKMAQEKFGKAQYMAKIEKIFSEIQKYA